MSCEVLDARLAVAGHLDVISDPVASKLVHTYLTSLEYELFLPWGSAKSSELPLIHTGSSVCLATQRALHRLHSHVVYLETSVRCAQVHQVLDSTENLAVESEAVGGSKDAAALAPAAAEAVVRARLYFVCVVTVDWAVETSPLSCTTHMRSVIYPYCIPLARRARRRSHADFFFAYCFDCFASRPHA